MKVLITGADGFIGSHLTEAMIRQGFEVKALVLYNSFNTWGWLDDLPAEIINNVEVISGDIRDQCSLRSAMNGCSAVMHLAALISIPYSYVSPDSYLETNIRGTLNVLQAARDLDLERVIHTSTSEVYGTARFVPITEEHPLQGQSPYSASKIGADHLAMSFHNSYNLPVSIIRPFNTYGPRQSARAIIPTVITQMLSGDYSIRIGSLSPTRDFNYVPDTVSGFIAALKTDKAIGAVVNIGSNYEVSIGRTIELIAKILEVDPKIEIDDKRIRPAKSEVERLWADNHRARQLMGWQPAYAGEEGFEKGLRETIDWFKQSCNLKKYKSALYNI